MKKLFVLLLIITIKNAGLSQITNLRLELNVLEKENILYCEGNIKLLETIDTMSFFTFDNNFLCQKRYKIDFTDIENNSLTEDILLIEDENNNYFSIFQFISICKRKEIEKYKCNEIEIESLIITKKLQHMLLTVPLNRKKMKSISKFRICYLKVGLSDNPNKNYLLKSNWICI